MYSLIFAQLLAATVALPHGASQPQGAALVLQHATIVDVVAERLVLAQTVIIRGRKILSVGADGTVPIPVGAQVIDCAGQFLIAGLWDMHVHIPEMAAPNDVKSSERVGWDYLSTLLLANGVTGARVPAGNLKRLSAIRAEVRSGALVGPRLLITGHKLVEQAVVQGAPFPIATEKDARLSVLLLKRDGADFVKLSPGLPAPFWRAAADQGRIEGFQVVGHLPTTVSLIEASDLGINSIEHLFNLPRETSRNDNLPNNQKLTEVLSRKTGRVLNWLRIADPPPEAVDVAIATHDTLKSQQKFAHLKLRGTWVTPTLVLAAAMFQEQDRAAALDRGRFQISRPDSGPLSDARGLSPRLYGARLLAFHLAIVRELHDAGVDLLAGSDAPTLNVPGFALHDELQLLVRAGLSPAAALRAATSDVGRFLHTDSIGVVRAGALADLVLLNENPLRDISATRRIATVIADGRVYRRDALNRMLDSAAAIARRVPRQQRADRISAESTQKDGKGATR